MSEREQANRRKAQKQPIEEVISTALSGESKELAAAFVSFVKSLRMTPQWASHHSWTVSYKGKRVCHVKISEQAAEATWYIRPAVQYDDALEAFCRAEGLVSCMLKNVHFCVACGRCAPGKTVTFFGQRLEHVCGAPIDFEFHNPDEEELECAKQLVHYARQKISQQCKGK